MQYLKPNVCKQLEAMGLVSESGMWCHIAPDSFHIPGKAKVTNNKRIVFCEGEEMVAAFTISDILLNADNARKLWSDREMFAGGRYIDEWRADWKANYYDGKKRTLGQAKDIMEKDLEYFRKTKQIVPEWQVKVHNLLDLHISGEDIEPHLLEAIESNKLCTK